MRAGRADRAGAIGPFAPILKPRVFNHGQFGGREFKGLTDLLTDGCDMSKLGLLGATQIVLDAAARQIGWQLWTAGAPSPITDALFVLGWHGQQLRVNKQIGLARQPLGADAKHRAAQRHQ